VPPPSRPRLASSTRRRGVWRRLVGLLAAAFVIVGLGGTASYWEAYYQHRGFVSVPRLPRAGAGRLLRVNFYSRSLRRAADYLVYLPAGYDRSRHYPVFYLLHGMPGRPQVYIDIANMDVRLDNRMSQGQVPPMILVFPDGRVGGSTLSDSEWANTPSGQFESYVLEVIQDVDRRFAATPDRQARVIGGFSAGGYGAINIALHHLDMFGSVQVWSGYFTQTDSGVFAHATSSALAYNSPIEYAQQLRHQLAAFPLRVFMFAGRADKASVRQIAPIARVLAAHGAEVSCAIYPGGHDWQLWWGHLNQMLILAGRDVLVPLAATRPTTHQSRPPTDRRTRPAQARRRAHSQRIAVPRRPSTGVARASLATPRPGATTASRTVRPGLTTAVTTARSTAGRLLAGRLLAGLLLAFLSAAMINVGFLLQHRGLTALGSPQDGRAALPRAMLRSRIWLGGQALGWLGFGAQIAAVSLAPLSLVQSFAAGGLALSVPLSAGLFDHRISRRQQLAVLTVALALATLPIGLAHTTDRLAPARLGGLVIAALTVAVPLALTRRAALQAIAAGIFYGVADAAIKAVSVGLSAHGPNALISGWTLLSALGTFLGFLAFQAALRAGNPVSGISLMNGLAALVALCGGLLAFDESLGTTPLANTAHSFAVALVLACVPVLATAQAKIAEPSHAADPMDNRAEIGIAAAPRESLPRRGRPKWILSRRAVARR